MRALAICLNGAKREQIVTLAKSADGVQTQDTRDKTKANIKNENESTVEVEHQH